ELGAALGARREMERLAKPRSIADRKHEQQASVFVGPRERGRLERRIEPRPPKAGRGSERREISLGSGVRELAAGRPVVEAFDEPEEPRQPASLNDHARGRLARREVPGRFDRLTRVERRTRLGRSAARKQSKRAEREASGEGTHPSDIRLSTGAFASARGLR